MSADLFYETFTFIILIKNILIKIPSEETFRNIAAAGFGLIVSVAILFIMQYLNASLYPTDGFSLSRESVYIDFVRDNPLFLAGMLISAATGSFMGGAIAVLVKPDLPSLYPIAIGTVLTVLGVVNLMMMPHPLWFWFVSIFIYIPSAWYGARFIHQKRNF